MPTEWALGWIRERAFERSKDANCTGVCQVPDHEACRSWSHVPTCCVQEVDPNAETSVGLICCRNQDRGCHETLPCVFKESRTEGMLNFREESFVRVQVSIRIRPFILFDSKGTLYSCWLSLRYIEVYTAWTQLLRLSSAVCRRCSMKLFMFSAS